MANEQSENASSAVNNLPSEITVRHRSGWGIWIIAFLGWVLVAITVSIALAQYYTQTALLNPPKGINESFHSGDEDAQDKIAIITIAGVIQDGHGFVKRQIDRVRDDENIKAIVVRVNSPGGTVSGSDYIFHHLRELRKTREIPMVVSMGSMAASGGYYVSMAVGDQEDSIFAEPTTTTGSIGVIIPHYNFSGLLADYKIEDDSIMSHPRKRMLSMSRPANPEHRLLLQGYVDESFERFKEIILEGRPKFASINPKTDLEPGEETDEAKQKIKLLSGERDLATGEIFTAMQAKKYGLVDQIGFIETAIERAAELANLKVDNSRVVKYSTPGPWIDLPYLSQADAGMLNKQKAIANLFEMSTPKAYYLASSVPPLMDSWVTEEEASRSYGP